MTWKRPERGVSHGQQSRAEPEVRHHVEIISPMMYNISDHMHQLGYLERFLVRCQSVGAEIGEACQGAVG